MALLALRGRRPRHGRTGKAVTRAAWDDTGRIIDTGLFQTYDLI